jgi:hypothetical protein
MFDSCLSIGKIVFDCETSHWMNIFRGVVCAPFLLVEYWMLQHRSPEPPQARLSSLMLFMSAKSLGWFIFVNLSLKTPSQLPIAHFLFGSLGVPLVSTTPGACKLTSRIVDSRDR